MTRNLAAAAVTTTTITTTKMIIIINLNQLTINKMSLNLNEINEYRYSFSSIYLTNGFFSVLVPVIHDLIVYD